MTPRFSLPLSGVVVGLLLPALIRAQVAPPAETFTYKKVGVLEIKVDVYLPAGNARMRPVLVYLHGGSLINGGRHQVANHQFKEAFLTEGFVVVSPDHRLAPETRLAAIVADVEDAFKWIREVGPGLFGADSNRIAVAGGSAGGYLTLVAGYRVKPPPFAMIVEMGYGDLIGPWQLRPSIHPPHYADSHLGETEAWRQVSGPPIANARDRPGNGGAFNDFIRRSAQWPQAISGWDPRTEAARYEPYLPLRNVTREFPPTILLHGHNDTDVPREQPELMAAAFTRHGVDHRLILLANGEHGFRGADPAHVASARREAVDFVRQRLPPAAPAGASTKE